LVTDQQNSIGIWYDVGNVDGVFINNWLENIHYDETHRKPLDVWPTGAGFYFEISRGAICAGNVFINCDTGIHLRNAADVQMYQNTLINSQVLIGRTERTTTGDHFDWHPSTGPDIDERIGHVFVNNLLYGDENFKKPLLYIWQPDTLCGIVTNPQLNQLDYNMYVQNSDTKNTPLIYWSTFKKNDCKTLSLKSLEDLKELNPGFSNKSSYFPNYNGPLFKGSHLGNYQLLQSFPGAYTAAELPSDVSKLLGKSEQYIGAYPPIKE
jgi:hypothetical protein